MSLVTYTVVATLPDFATRDRYLAWLAGGHVQEVVAGGALSAAVVRIDDPCPPYVCEARYLFPDAETLELYLRDHAPRLRAQGLALFGDSGVTFQRSVGVQTFPTKGEPGA
jgi:hypothetical protein